MAVEKFINLMMKRHKPVSHKDNHNRVLKNKPLKEKLLFNLLDLKKYIALITVIALISIYMLSLKWMRTIREEKADLDQK